MNKRKKIYQIGGDEPKMSLKDPSKKYKDLSDYSLAMDSVQKYNAGELDKKPLRPIYDPDGVLDTITMPNGQTLSKGEYISKYGENSWNGVTRKKLYKYGGPGDDIMEKTQKDNTNVVFPLYDLSNIKIEEPTVDYNALKYGIRIPESQNGKLMRNPQSSATGLYGQLYNEIKDMDFMKGKSRDKFQTDTNLQNKVFEMRYNNELKNINGLKSNGIDLHNEYFLSTKYTPTQIAGISNLLGREGTRKYLGYVERDGKSLESVFPDKYGKEVKQDNKTPEEYLKEAKLKQYGGPMKKKLYAFGSDSTNVVGAPQVSSSPALTPFNTVPQSYYSNKDGATYSSNYIPSNSKMSPQMGGYVQGIGMAAVASIPQVTNDLKDSNATSKGQVSNVADDLGRNVGSAAMGPFGGIAFGLQDEATKIEADGKYVKNKDTGRMEPVLDTKSQIANNWTTDTGTQKFDDYQNIINQEKGWGWDLASTLVGPGMDHLVRNIEAVVNGGSTNQSEYQRQQQASLNYTSGDSSMHYAFGGPTPVFKNGTMLKSKFVDFKDKSFKTHAEGGIMVANKGGEIHETEANETMQIEKDGSGFVFSTIMGTDKDGNYMIVPQGTTAPKNSGFTSFAEQHRKLMNG